MGKNKVVPKPKKKDYTYEDEFSRLSSHITGSKMVKFDKDGYIEHLERYSSY